MRRGGALSCCWCWLQCCSCSWGAVTAASHLLSVRSHLRVHACVVGTSVDHVRRYCADMATNSCEVARTAAALRNMAADPWTTSCGEGVCARAWRMQMHPVHAEPPRSIQQKPTCPSRIRCTCCTMCSTSSSSASKSGWGCWVCGGALWCVGRRPAGASSPRGGARAGRCSVAAFAAGDWGARRAVEGRGVVPDQVCCWCAALLDDAAIWCCILGRSSLSF